MTYADLIWNRAALDDGGRTPQAGDRALASLLHAHGLVMNGGVLHAVEILSANELADAQQGYQFFELSAVADLLRSARSLLESGREFNESSLDREYLKFIPADSALVERFETRLQTHPRDFAPL